MMEEVMLAILQKHEVSHSGFCPFCNTYTSVTITDGNLMDKSNCYHFVDILLGITGTVVGIFKDWR